MKIRPTAEISPSKRIMVRVTHPRPSGIAISGSGAVVASDLDARSLDVSVSGSASIRLAGVTEALSVSVSGSADIQTESLVAKSVVIRVSGSANAVVTATQSLDARVSGSAQVLYAGSPASVQTSVSGSGSIRAK